MGISKLSAPERSCKAIYVIANIYNVSKVKNVATEHTVYGAMVFSRSRMALLRIHTKDAHTLF